MNPRTYLAAAALAGLAACGAPDGATGPATAALDTEPGAGSTRTVFMLDACDPASFDAVLGAGSCVRQGSITFEKFIAELTSRGYASAWKFAPRRMDMQVGQVLQAKNAGGEVHTFTEVKDFGGGVVPLLNDLSGNPVPAPECLALAPEDFIPAGAYSEAEEEDDPEVARYQCCIHPWMRTVVHVHG